MKYYRLIFINLVIIILTTIYLLFTELSSPLIQLSDGGRIFAELAIMLFFININVFTLIQLIKRTKLRKIKITSAKLLRKIMKLHIYLAIFGASFIIIHAIINLRFAGSFYSYFHIKLITGYLAIIVLSINLYAGYYRFQRASGFRRKFHLYMALTFFLFAIIHILS